MTEQEALAMSRRLREEEPEASVWVEQAAKDSPGSWVVMVTTPFIPEHTAVNSPTEWENYRTQVRSLRDEWLATRPRGTFTGPE